jgi:hypothetical protein
LTVGVGAGGVDGHDVDVYRDFLGRAAELGFTDVLAPWPRHEGPFAGDEAILDTVATDVLPTLS